MAFRFPLETLLRYRRSVERQCELEFLQALQQVVAVQHEIEMVDGQLAALKTSGLRELETGVTASQLHFDAQRESVLASRRAFLMIELERREGLRLQRQQEFQHARREREVLESLRQQHHQAYLREEARREQKRLDDLFLQRREYSRRS
jgi:flagellar export protein FliJ